MHYIYSIWIFSYCQNIILYSLCSCVLMLWQGLYPGYIIFFVQSALMIAGSRGNNQALLLSTYSLFRCLNFSLMVIIFVVIWAAIYRWQQSVPPNMALLKKLLAFLNFAYTILVLNYSSVGFMVLSFSSFPFPSQTFWSLKSCFNTWYFFCL